MHSGCFWFKGGPLPDGSLKEFDKDCAFTLQDFTATRNKTSVDHPFTYDLTDVNNISNILGIPWEPCKDVPCSTSPMFIDFTWDLEHHTVALT